MFYMIQKYFSQYSELSRNEAGEPNFLGELILQNYWIICFTFLYFNFKYFMEWNSTPFISFQAVL